MAEGQLKPVYKPRIPFIGSLLGGLQEGKRVFIIGRVFPDSKRFCVNLQCGSGSEADIALHFNPRFEKAPAYIVYNSREKNKLGDEKNTSDCPLLQGQHFILEILVTKEGYQTVVNGKHNMDFEHRIPLTRVNTISVDQMVDVDFIACQKEVAVSSKKLLTDGLKPGQNILVYGIPDPDCKWIEINLRHKFGIAFHYKFRFVENLVVRNSWNGNWGAEEKCEDIPFQLGQFFQLKISCKQDQFEVFVNGQQNHTFKHRFTKLEDIDVIEVYGDLNQGGSRSVSIRVLK